MTGFKIFMIKHGSNITTKKSASQRALQIYFWTQKLNRLSKLNMQKISSFANLARLDSLAYVCKAHPKSW